MQNREVPEGAKLEVGRLVGFLLSNIIIGQFHLRLEFTSGRGVYIDVNKELQFRLSDEKWWGYDPTTGLADEPPGDTRFIRLVGRTCSRAVLTNDEFELAFAEGGELRVTLLYEDFEPLVLLGDISEGKLDFLWAL